MRDHCRGRCPRSAAEGLLAMSRDQIASSVGEIASARRVWWGRGLGGLLHVSRVGSTGSLREQVHCIAYPADEVAGLE